MQLKTKTYFLLLLLFHLAVIPVKGQFYSAGEDPASVRWLQINTENFQVIFPEGYESQGKYITDLLEWSYQNAGKSLEHQPRKVSVIVHNRTIVSNGFVSWAPRRIELYTNPPANNDFHDWMERLVIHEFRHVVQIDKLNQGLTRLLGILFGEMGTGAVVGHMPLWFLEGDAVVMETALTNAGRGRLPRFEQGLRAQVLTRGAYSFDKAVFGSYKDHVPNYYELGYQLVAAARVEHGADAWSKIVDNVGRRPWGLFPFSAQMERSFGRGQTRHYNRTFRRLQSKWTDQMSNHSYSPSMIISPSNRLFTNYSHPHWVDENNIIALKTGLKDIPRIVMMDKHGNEEVLHYPGTLFPNSFHYSNGVIAWSEYKPDPRWEHRNYANIMLLDIYTRTLTQLTSKGRYFSPALAPDGERVAAVQTEKNGNYRLVILEASTGAVLKEFEAGENNFIMHPAWHNTGDKIAVIALDEHGKRMELIDLTTGESHILFRAEQADISSPVFWGEDIVFNGTWSGIDNIYRFDMSNGEITQIVSSTFGAVNASPNDSNDKIAFSDYTANGYTINILSGDQLTDIPLSEITDHSVGFHKTLSQQENAVIGPQTVERGTYDIKPYRRLPNLFHLHSWFPAHLNIDNMDVDPGASLLFQNKLSTSFAQLGYRWDLNEETGRYSISYNYRGWYPVLGISAETGERRLYYSIDEEPYNFLWQESNLNVSLSVPLRFHHNEYFSGITPLIRAGISNASSSRNTPDSIFVGNNNYYNFASTTFFTQDYRILAYRQRRSVARDLLPRDGQIIEVQYRHTPFGEYDMGHILALRAIFYSPGLFRHHGVRLTASHQQKKQGENTRDPETIAIFYNFGNLINYPRGMTGQNHRRLTNYTVDYHFPLLYPDLSIPYLMYLKRLRGYAFTDLAFADPFAENLNIPVRTETLYSYGAGFLADFHLFRFLAPISAGLQIAFPNGGEPVFQTLFSISL